MLQVLSPEAEEKLTKSLARAIRDITKLNDDAYRFISCCSGFSAHYDRHGFIQEYSGGYRLLRNAMLENSTLVANQWLNFSPKDRNYDYMMQKKRIYNEALCRAEKRSAIEKKISEAVNSRFSWR